MKHQTKFTLLCIAMLVIGLTACGGAAQPEATATPLPTPTNEAETETDAEDTETDAEDTNADASTSEEETSTTDEKESVTEMTADEMFDGEGIVTDSGLRVIEIEEGTGESPQVGDFVEVHYTGTLLDGTKFDSSVDRGQPFEFRLGKQQVIAGWDEGIAMLKQGGKATLVIPSELGYGSHGTGAIPPNATLVFEVELISFRPGPPGAPEAPQAVATADYTETDSGLQYYDIKVGDGETSAEGNKVTVHYTGWLTNSTMFDSSLERGEPFSLVLGKGQVIPGWDEGLTGMQVGGQRQLVIPADLAYGDHGAGNVIPPGATLIFEVELVEVAEGPPGAPEAPQEVAEEDFTTTDSGLQYYDFEVGDGATPTEGQIVSVHYTGWLTDGTKFDSSLDRGDPIQFSLGVGQVIPGWDEGVSTMQVGGKRQLIIPADLAYGSGGAGNVIPPGATLVFEVELVDVQ